MFWLLSMAWCCMEYLLNQSWSDVLLVSPPNLLTTQPTLQRRHSGKNMHSWHCASTAEIAEGCCVISQFLIRNPKPSTVQPAMKKVYFIPARLRTHGFIRQYWAGEIRREPQKLQLSTGASEEQSLNIFSPKTKSIVLGPGEYSGWYFIVGYALQALDLK